MIVILKKPGSFVPDSKWMKPEVHFILYKARLNVFKNGGNN